MVVTVGDSEEDEGETPLSKLKQKAVVLLSPMRINGQQSKRLKIDYDVKKVNKYGETKLHINCRNGHYLNVKAGTFFAHQYFFQ